MLVPLQDRIVVRREPENALTDFGLVLPDTARLRAMAGTVLEVGQGVWQSGRRVQLGVEVGDRVLLTRWAGTDLSEIDVLAPEERRRLVVVAWRDVLAVIGGARVS